jgi:photosystem II stability/assembly factor-like uncharacterized protein
MTIGAEYLPQVKAADFRNDGSAWLLLARRNPLRTSDGGKDWQALGQEDTKRFACLSFIDPLHGWAVDERGQTWESTDSGNYWSLISDPRHDDEGISSPGQLRFIDNRHGWLLDAFAVWRTEDGGRNWKLSLPAGEYRSKLWQPTRASFISETAAWVAGTGGIIYRTADGGNTWHAQDLGIQKADLRWIQFIDTKVGWTYSGDGALYNSDDGGLTWDRQAVFDKTIHVESLHFVSANEGWAAGWRADEGNDASDLKSRRGVLMHSVTGGATWQVEQLSSADSSYDYVYFTGADSGWLIGRDNVYHSADGGKSWILSVKLKGK